MTRDLVLVLATCCAAGSASGHASLLRSVPTRHVATGGRPDTLVADPVASRIRWTGTKFRRLGKHEGTIALAAGELVLRHEQLEAGRFTIDMRRMEITDIPDTEPVPRRRLLAHLQGPDFFDVARYPTAQFVANRAARIGAARYRLSGDLTMHGVSRPIEFETEVRWPEVGHMIATATLTLDRQRWGIAYRGSRVTNDLVDDDIQIFLVLDARRRTLRLTAR